MTGYGVATGHAGSVALSVEVRSVNQRFLDLKVSGPREYLPFESALRRRVAEVVERGRVEVSITRQSSRRSGRVKLQTDAADAYWQALGRLAKRYDIGHDADLALLAAQPGVFESVEEPGRVDAEMEVVRTLLDRALRAHDRERKREGRDLLRDMRARLGNLAKIRRALRRLAAKQAVRLRQRLEKRLGKLLAGDVDPVRLVQEAAILADRADVNEELVRLDSHADALGATLREDGPIGKRIEFLLQEVLRELNTIAPKSTDVAMTTLVVDGKGEVEKLKEQAQNAE